MNFDSIIIALIWGAISSYLILRTVSSGLAIIFCLHGLLLTRWKRLANKAKPGQIRYSISIHQLLLAVFYGVFSGFLLEIGNNYVQRKLHFNYHGYDGLLLGVIVTLFTIIFLRAAWRRLVVAWKITHEFDYAEKRQRTFLLRG